MTLYSDPLTGRHREEGGGRVGEKRGKAGDRQTDRQTDRHP